MKTPFAESTDPGVGEPIEELALSRTATLHDPLTTGLLAEVSRRAETLEFDAETIAQAREAANALEDDNPTRPGSRRRARDS